MTAFQQRPELQSGAGRTTLRPQAGKATGGAIVVGRALGTVIVTVHGRIDLIPAAALTAVLDDLIDGQGNLAIVVDLRDVPWIDGAGVHVLASAAERIEVRGGELRLGGPSGVLADALSFAGLGRLVSVPFEQAQRPWPRARAAAGALRRAAVDPPRRHWPAPTRERTDGMIRGEPVEGAAQAKVTFAVPEDGMNGEAVAVVGDFNDWDPAATPMRPEGAWRVARLTLPAGERYTFR